MSVDQVLETAKTITTIRVRLPEHGSFFTKTLFLTEKHLTIKTLALTKSGNIAIFTSATTVATQNIAIFIPTTTVATQNIAIFTSATTVATQNIARFTFLHPLLLVS
jgi:hypothetical protein